jgi:hypothetical protein
MRAVGQSLGKLAAQVPGGPGADRNTGPRARESQDGARFLEPEAQQH